MRLGRSILLIALLVAILVGGQFVSAQEAPLGGFDEYVNTGVHFIRNS